MSKEHPVQKDLIELYSEIDLNSLLDKIAGKIRHYLNCEQASIFLYNELKDELYFEIATGEKQDELKQIAFKKGEGIVGWVAENRQALTIHDCLTDPRFSSKSDLKTHFSTRSIQGVPVLYNNKLLGVIEAVNKKEGKFASGDQEILEAIARLIAIPLQNAVLFKKVRQETQEKDRLLELAKTISYSSNQDEVFEKLKEIICEIVTPLEINVIVYGPENTPANSLNTHSKSQLYRLLDNTWDEMTAGNTVCDTIINEYSAIFPLKSQDRRLGTLDLKVAQKIPEEVSSLIRGLAAFVAILVEKLEMQERIIEKERIEKELEIARRIQQSFLPSGYTQLKGLDVAYINIPSSQVGGDYYDIIPFGEHETVFTINDISGHGIPASLLMAIFRTNFVFSIKKNKNIVAAINHLNDIIAETTEPNHFVTSFTCLLDREKMTLSYVNAGHNPPFILRADQLIKLDRASFIVGSLQDVPYETTQLPVKQGDILVLYTDGIVETENPSEQQYTVNRLQDFIKNNREFSAEEIKEKFIAELRKYSGRKFFEDDITFILIKII
ncbi:MAG: SpoIIE family protein phosphatase [Acidobacteria bacterium]|nr:SpoIIE family protein phosphatase [Acidobacteriota bacterium]